MTKQQLKRTNEIACEIADWASANFNVERPKIGIQEEVGELSHCFLKRIQGIRGFNDIELFVNKTKDAIGDIAIYTLHDLKLSEFVLTGVKDEAPMIVSFAELSNPNVIDMLEEMLGNLGEAASHNLQGHEYYETHPIHESIISQLNLFAAIFETDVLTILEDVWGKVVSSRDWKKNKQDGLDHSMKTNLK